MNEEKEINKEKSNSGSAFGALLLITAGAILLLNNFGYLPWNVWDMLWRFWPIMLIIWGLEAIFGKNIAGRVIVSIIGFILLFYIISYSISIANPQLKNWLDTNLPNLRGPFEQINPQKQSQKGNKVFKCNQATGECEILYK